MNGAKIWLQNSFLRVKNPPPPKFGQLKLVGKNHMVTEKPGQTKTQTHEHTHAQTHTNTNEYGGTAVEAQGLVQLSQPSAGAAGQPPVAVQLLLPDLVRDQSLAQLTKTVAGPAGSLKLPPGPAASLVTVTDPAESYAGFAASLAKIDTLPVEPKIMNKSKNCTSSTQSSLNTCISK